MLMALAVVLAAPVAAQTVRGSIGGVVTDSSGAVVPGAQVKLTHGETGRTRQMAADDEGEFQFSALPPGSYRVEIERSGFQQSVHELVLALNQDARIAGELVVAGTTDVVPVTESELLQATSAARSTVIENRQVTRLPLDGRNFFELSLLVPGTAPAAQGSAGSVRGDFAIHVSGSREDANLFLLDGVYNGDPKLNGVGLNPPVDAIREFEVLTGNYDASFGRNAGGQVNVALKSGTNELHGSLYHFFRNAALDARNHFAPADQPDPKYQRNQFGVTLGGPIVRDRTFFFGDYEGRIGREGITTLTTVPTDAERMGDFTNSSLPTPVIPGFGPSPIIPPAFQHPVGAAIAALYPSPNRVPPPGSNANFVSSPTQRDNQHHFDARVDHSFNANSELAVRYSFADGDLFEPFSGRTFSLLPGYGNDVPRRAQNMMVSETHIFSPHWVNEARFAFHRVAIQVNQEGQGTSINQQVGLPDISPNARDLGLSFLRVSGFSPLGHEFNNPQASVTNTFQVIDHVSYARGRHSVKFGGEFRAHQQNGFRDVQSRGLIQFLGPFTGNPLADLLLGLPTVSGVAQLDNPQHLRAESWALFGQDSYRIRPDLTITAGVRYEFTSAPVDINDRANIYDPTTGMLVQVGTGGVPRGGYQSDANNVAPRVGIAWSPGRGDTVVRAGYGIYYDQWALAPGEGLYFSAPFFDFRLFFTLPPQPGFPGYTLTLTDPFPLATFPLPTAQSALTFQRDLSSPYAQHWNLTIQQRLGATRSLEVGYVGTKGTHMITARDINQPAPTALVFPNPRPNPAFDDITAVESRASSIYHALQARFQQRLWCGMTVLSSYTWSKSIDDASG
ncbi:MAG: TonB-dependent receptor domain-containing protein, partial [Candidatus Acidiferrales bacterium]